MPLATLHTLSRACRAADGKLVIDGYEIDDDCYLEDAGAIVITLPDGQDTRFVFDAEMAVTLEVGQAEIVDRSGQSHAFEFFALQALTERDLNEAQGAAPARPAVPRIVGADKSVDDLTDAELDFLLACHKGEAAVLYGGMCQVRTGFDGDVERYESRSYVNDYARGGPLLADMILQGLLIERCDPGYALPAFKATMDGWSTVQRGDALLATAARSFVASTMGAQVFVPRDEAQPVIERIRAIERQRG